MNIADDHALIRDDFQRTLVLYSDLVAIGEAADGEIAVKLTGKLLPDEALLDYYYAQSKWD